jgi:hypothetical protein
MDKYLILTDMAEFTRINNRMNAARGIDTTLGYQYTTPIIGSSGIAMLILANAVQILTKTEKGRLIDCLPEGFTDENT